VSARRFAVFSGDGSMQILELDGRPGWALDEMINARAEGITAINYPGMRLADAVFKLRQAGLTIETIHEPHGGEFKGRHARYILKSRVERLSDLQVAA
jgi:hypothetical protein